MTIRSHLLVGNPEAAAGLEITYLGPELEFGGNAQESRAVGALNGGGGDLRLVTARGSVRVSER